MLKGSDWPHPEKQDVSSEVHPQRSPGMALTARVVQHLCKPKSVAYIKGNNHIPNIVQELAPISC